MRTTTGGIRLSRANVSLAADVSEEMMCAMRKRGGAPRSGAMNRVQTALTRFWMKLRKRGLSHERIGDAVVPLWKVTWAEMRARFREGRRFVVVVGGHHCLRGIMTRTEAEEAAADAERRTGCDSELLDLEAVFDETAARLEALLDGAEVPAFADEH